jgi:hypothetical protein
MIYDELVAAYDAVDSSDEASRWRAFAIAVLKRVLSTEALQGEPARLLTEMLTLWCADQPMDEERLADAGEAIWSYVNERRGVAGTRMDLEERVLRSSIFALQPRGDRDEAIEAAGWIEDFLTDSVG